MKQFIVKCGLPLILSFALIGGTINSAEAQCPMCRMSAESNLKNGGSEGKGLNNGILYLLATPYLAVGLIGFIWWKNRRKEEDEVLEFSYDDEID